MTFPYAHAKLVIGAKSKAAAGPTHRARLFGSDSVKIVVVALGLWLAVQAGGALANAVQADTPALCLACFAGPVAVAAAIFWLVGRLL